MSELAAEAFDQLSTQHARSSMHITRRVLVLATLITLLIIFVIVIAIDAVRTSAARRYAAAVNWKQMQDARCDAPLGKRRMWIGSVVQGNELCVAHSINHSHIVRASDDVLSFFVIGDWGRDGMCCQRDVAAEMAIAARSFSPHFIASVGDNFYRTGIESSTDKQVDTSWRDVYIRPYEAMQKIPWIVVLGNHDHRGNVMAQTVLGRDDELWHMPERYFFETTESGEVFMAFLDTTVMYYTMEQLKMFRGDATTMFYRDNQVAAFKKALVESKAKWKIVFGHHPFISSSYNYVQQAQNQKQLRTILLRTMQDNGVVAYFSGHEHTLEHMYSEGLHMFISGGGSKISPILHNPGESVFALDRQGYMTVSITKKSTMDVRIVDFEGKVVHTTSIEERGAE